MKFLMTQTMVGASRCVRQNSDGILQCRKNLYQSSQKVKGYTFGGGYHAL